ncbi:MAG: hypothetical protein HY898_08545 [Deltaproteobacteria bacterium]|nr:hypothetical protein [Deltaproteobacteria bacterium]
MTPDLKQSIAARGRSLQKRLHERVAEPIAAAMEAKRLFEDAADESHTRWLTLELTGYGDVVAATPLHQVLRVAPGDRLAVHVTAYRTQRGCDASSGRPQGEFRHFFVESLSELVAARDRLAKSASGVSVLLTFRPQLGDTSYPTTGEFSRDVFDRILAGFLAALHLQLGNLPQ